MTRAVPTQGKAHTSFVDLLEMGLAFSSHGSVEKNLSSQKVPKLKVLEMALCEVHALLNDMRDAASKTLYR